MRGSALLLLSALAGTAVAEEVAVYRARGADARLFDQYDNDGYALSVAAGPDGAIELTVRVSDAPLQTAAPYGGARKRDPALAPAADRDAFARRLAEGSATEEEAVRRILVGLRGELRYDPDRLRRQDPAAVFASRRGYCVGFAELAVDLLRRVGISARTIQGILRTEQGADHFEAAIGGAYHRWIEVHYPDCGNVFSDPSASVNGVDARYIPFARRSIARPRELAVEAVGPLSGNLSYRSIAAGGASIRVRAAAKPGDVR